MLNKKKNTHKPSFMTPWHCLMISAEGCPLGTFPDVRVEGLNSRPKTHPSGDQTKDPAINEPFKYTNLNVYLFNPRQQMLFEKNKPKDYPNSNDMRGRFLRTGFVWVRHVNNSRNFDPRRRLGDKCGAQLVEPSKQLL